MTWAVYDGHLVKIFAADQWYEAVWPSTGKGGQGAKYSHSNRTRFNYCVQFSNGHLLSWILDEYVTKAGVCAECSGPTVEDYLCQGCRHEA